MKNKNILVTGGAGYIGAQNCKNLFKKGFLPIAYDNLSEGNEYAVKWGPFVKGDILDFDKLIQTLNEYKPIAVMHFAANALVSESTSNPKKYYQNNVVGTLNLLNAMLSCDIKNFIFSSSCATYGNPKYTPMCEKHPQNPISAYGKTKYMIEKILEDYEKAYNFKYVCLRYFNASGADTETEIGEDRILETHLIPLAIDVALKTSSHLNIYGTNFDTKDGTAIRDYIHIEDLASAHFKALNHLLDGKGSVCLNLGSEIGYSILDVIKEIETQTETKIDVKHTHKRDGDPAILFADSSEAKKTLNWTAKHSDLKNIIKTAIKWHIKKKNFIR